MLSKLVEIGPNISFSNAHKVCLRLSGKKLFIGYKENYETSYVNEVHKQVDSGHGLKFCAIFFFAFLNYSENHRY